jgi:hypothetical protein
MGVGITLRLVRTIEILYLFQFLSHHSLVGDVWWLDRTSAFQQNLVYINDQNRAIIKVDNVSQVPFNEKRNSVFVTTVVSPDQILINHRFELHLKSPTGLAASGS